MKTKILNISVAIIFAYFIINAFGFILSDLIDNYILFDKILKILLQVCNFIVFIFIFLFLRNNRLRVQTILSIIFIVGLFMFLVVDHFGNNFSFIPSGLEVRILFSVGLFLLAFVISILLIKKEGISGLLEIKNFARWILISSFLGIGINFFLSTIEQGDKSNLSLILLIIPYYFIYKYSKTLQETE